MTLSLHKAQPLRFCFVKISSFLMEKWLETVCKLGHGNWKKCLGSTEPKWLGFRGRLGPGWAQGERPAGGSTGVKPRGRKRIWVFWRPICCLSVHRNCEKHCFFALKHQNKHFITFSITPTYFENYQHGHMAKVTKFINIFWDTVKSMCTWATIYQTIRAEMTVLPPKVMNSLSIIKKPLESAVVANTVTA